MMSAGSNTLWRPTAGTIVLLSIIYFVTICVRDRRRVLATPEVFEAIKTAIPQLRKWHVLAGSLCLTTPTGLLRPPRIESCRSEISRTGSNAHCESTLVHNHGNGSADVSIAYCVPTRICGANGFM